MDAQYLARGQMLLYGGSIDPRIAPGVDAPVGAIYIQSAQSLTAPPGTCALYRKLDNGLTTNWLEIPTIVAIQAVASVLYQFDTATPFDIYTAEQDDRIVLIQNFVETSFDDAAATISVGDDQGDPVRFMPTGASNLPGAPNTYVANPAPNIYTMNAGEKVQGFLTPGASAQGQGVIVVSKMIITGAQ